MKQIRYIQVTSSKICFKSNQGLIPVTEIFEGKTFLQCIVQIQTEYQKQYNFRFLDEDKKRLKSHTKTKYLFYNFIWSYLTVLY